MSVNVYVTQGASGVVRLEKAGAIGRELGVSDFDDQHLSIRISKQVGVSGPTLPEGYVIQSGDRLEFDILIPSPEAGTVSDPPGGLFLAGRLNVPSIAAGTWVDHTARTTVFMGVDLKFVSGPFLSDGFFTPVLPLDSATGINVTARGDKISIADDTWHHMSTDLSFYASLTLDHCELQCDEDFIARYVMYVRNIFITRAGVVVYKIYEGYQNPYRVGYASGNCGYAGGWQIENGLYGDLEIFGDLGADNLTGPYVSPSVTLLTGTTHTASTSMGTIYNNSATGNMTVTLYLANAVPAGRRLTLINLHATNTLTVSRAGSDTIDGATTKGPYAQYLGVTLESNGLTQFHVVP